MKVKFLLGCFLAYFLLLGYAVPAIACDCPDCPDCHTSTGPPDCECKPKGNCWDGCPCAECVNCYCANYKCNDCQTCIDEDDECECIVPDVYPRHDGCLNMSIFVLAEGLPHKCCEHVVWSADGDYPRGPEEGFCDFETTWHTVGIKTVTATTPCGSYSGHVIILQVDQVVEEGTDDEGPLYVCIDGFVGLEATSDYWPLLPFYGCCIEWSIEIQPDGADASITPDYPAVTAVLGGLTEPGTYIVKARTHDPCGLYYGPGDTITVKTFGGPIISLDDCGGPYGKYLLLANPASESRTDKYRAAPGQPSGTTYKWEISSGETRAHIVGSDTGPTVTLRADQEGNLTIKLTYTNSGINCISYFDTAVQKPNKANSFVTCGSRDGYCNPAGERGAYRWVYYHIRDGENRPIPHARWDEWWHCSGSPKPCCWAGEDVPDVACNGIVSDYLFVNEQKYCDNWGLLCSDRQTIKVSGWPVSGHFWDNNLYYYDANYTGIKPFIKLSPHCKE